MILLSNKRKHDRSIRHDHLNHASQAHADDLCDAWHDDDGLDERRRWSHRRRLPRDQQKPPRKRAQLIAQIRRALLAAWATTFDDPDLAAAHLLDLRPAPDAMHLELLIALPPDATLSAAQARAAINAQLGWLRSEVAAAIHRRRVPHLRVQVL